MKTIVKNILKKYGYDLVPSNKNGNDDNFPPDLSDDEKEIFNKAKPFTMTSIERAVSLIQAVKYVVENKIEGDFVECGVWRGGSMMIVALVLQQLGVTSRKLYLYDTFEGMPAPSENDVDFQGTAAAEVFKEIAETPEGWCYADQQDVLRNLHATDYPKDRIFLVEGKVEDTIPATLPEKICLLRLDTDWYDSTRHELVHLYPNLSENGVLIIDDYGHWQGARKATDEYFSEMKFKPFLQRIDYTGRLLIKSQK